MVRQIEWEIFLDSMILDSMINIQLWWDTWLYLLIVVLPLYLLWGAFALYALGLAFYHTLRSFAFIPSAALDHASTSCVDRSDPHQHGTLEGQALFLTHLPSFTFSQLQQCVLNLWGVSLHIPTHYFSASASAGILPLPLAHMRLHLWVQTFFFSHRLYSMCLPYPFAYLNRLNAHSNPAVPNPEIKISWLDVLFGFLHLHFYCWYRTVALPICVMFFIYALASALILCPLMTPWIVRLF